MENFMKKIANPNSYESGFDRGFEKRRSYSRMAESSYPFWNYWNPDLVRYDYG